LFGSPELPPGVTVEFRDPAGELYWQQPDLADVGFEYKKGMIFDRKPATL